MNMDNMMNEKKEEIKNEKVIVWIDDYE